jgi:hypothetical protein
MWRFSPFLIFPHYRVESIMMINVLVFAVTWYVNTLPTGSPCLICGCSCHAAVVLAVDLGPQTELSG